ncbi:MAG: NAD(P)H-dependent oxidoreductase subunit E [Actinomycetota bacterium]|nr:NAD(P)H-dependent oxidoreductase subunit E [Actinomycetota bacterium]
MTSATADAVGARGTPGVPAGPAHPSEDRRWRQVDVRIRRLGARPDGLIEVLHTLQQLFGYLDDDALAYVSEALGVPPSQVMGVATFYSFFVLKPQGAHTCVVCTGTACYLNGAKAILRALREALGVEVGGTTADASLSLLGARCLGACSQAPAVVLDGEVHGKVLAEEITALVASHA